MGDFAAFEEKMREADLGQAAIDAFRLNYEQLVEGVTGLLPEDEIEAVHELPHLVDLKDIGKGRSEDSAVQNGGRKTFLDLIADQIKYTRQQYGSQVRFVLMNSFSTSDDTKEFLSAKHADLLAEEDVELVQNKSPKVDAETMAPASFPSDPDLEWCPPGHGDIYPSLLGSGMLERLVTAGIAYLFVSNSDNLGATLDMDLLAYFGNSGKAFLMEA
ncbi:hypothetical protein WJX81_004986, partial [Elliptochloris bilobata]